MRNILVALEITSADEFVIAHATAMARAFQANLRLIHVAAPPPDFVGYEAGPQYIRDVRAEELKHEHTELHRMRDRLLAMGISTDVRLVQGATVETLMAEADAFVADLLVLGSHGRRGLAKLFQGSVSEAVLHEHKLPLLIVPTPQHTDPTP
ncbi:MAG TPA: universal stress protein [Flavobacteriales bacterium]